MLSRVVSAWHSSRIPTLSIAWTSTIETDAVVTAVGGIKATIIAISSLLLIGVVIIVILTPTTALSTLLLIFLVFLLLLLVGCRTDSSTNNGTTSHSDYSTHVMTTPTTGNTSNGRT